MHFKPITSYHSSVLIISQLNPDLYEGQKEIDLSDYIQNQEWDIIGTSAVRRDMYYPCCPENYPHIIYNLTMQRKTNYYTYVYVGPAVVLSLLAPFIFLLPPGDPQKMTLGKYTLEGGGGGLLYEMPAFLCWGSRNVLIM